VIMSMKGKSGNQNCRQIFRSKAKVSVPKVMLPSEKEVIVVSFTWIASVSCVLHMNPFLSSLT